MGPGHLLWNRYMDIKTFYEDCQCVSAVCVRGGGNRRYHLLGGIRLIIRTGQSNAGTNNNGCEETENIKAPARFSPVSLFMMIYNFMYILPLYPALFWI